MRFLTTALVQALPWIQQQSPVTVPLAAAALGLKAHRLLSQDDDWLTEDDDWINDPFLNEIMSDLKSCDIDVIAIENKITDLVISGELPTPSPEESSLEPSQVVSLTNEIMAILAPNEKKCTSDEVDKYFTVFGEELNHCTGLDQVFPEESANQLDTELDAELKEIIKTNCFDPQVVAQDPDTCMDALLDDNPIGFMLRHFYRNLKKYVACFETLSKDLPTCYVTMEDIMDKVVADSTASQEDIEMAQEAMKLALPDPAYSDMHTSLTFLRKEICMMGKGVDMLEGLCLDELETLDQCLTVDASSCATTQHSCTESGSTLFALPPKLTQGMLPDVCADVIPPKDEVGSGIEEHFANWMSQCHADDIVDPHPTWLNEVGAEKEEVKSKSTSAAGPELTGGTKPKFFYIFVAGTVLLVLLIGILAGLRTSPRPQRSAFKQVPDMDHNELV